MFNDKIILMGGAEAINNLFALYECVWPEIMIQ